uniref:Uncharacterized protein n=1 Tax=Brassica oleracea var. oleracea TaxID=109376 RepID=A0A0D3BLS3_BRAOL
MKPLLFLSLSSNGFVDSSEAMNTLDLLLAVKNESFVHVKAHRRPEAQNKFCTSLGSQEAYMSSCLHVFVNKKPGSHITETVLTSMHLVLVGAQRLDLANILHADCTSHGNMWINETTPPFHLHMTSQPHHKRRPEARDVILMISPIKKQTVTLPSSTKDLHEPQINEPPCDLPDERELDPNTGLQKENKQLDTEIHMNYIYDGHVSNYMKMLNEDQPEKFQTHFSQYLKKGVDAEGMEELVLVL